jgi:hypothetical protein
LEGSYHQEQHGLLRSKLRRYLTLLDDKKSKNETYTRK